MFDFCFVGAQTPSMISFPPAASQSTPTSSAWFKQALTRVLSSMFEGNRTGLRSRCHVESLLHKIQEARKWYRGHGERRCRIAIIHAIPTTVDDQNSQR